MKRSGETVKDKHLAVRIQQCLALAEASNCPRRTFGALLVDPKRNVVLMDGYNGGPRGGGRLCGGEECLRDTMNIESGTRVEIGCHHAEMNLICNAAANGVPTNNAWLIVTGEPCMMCAGTIYWAEIGSVVFGMTEKRLAELTDGDDQNPTPDLDCRTVFASGRNTTTVRGPFPELEADIVAQHAAFWNH